MLPNTVKPPKEVCMKLSASFATLSALALGMSALAPQVQAAPAASHAFDARGIYLTATSMAIPRFYKLVDGMKAAGLNTVLFDAKDEDGIVSYPSQVPLAKEIGAFKEGPIRDLKKKVDYLHSKGIHVAGRICLFHDPILARHRHVLAIKTKSGALFLEKHKPAWANPYNPAVQQYMIDLAKELAASGVDEVQFDYIRYPAQGNIKDIDYGFDPKTHPKHQVITGFLQRAQSELHKMGKMVSIDVYGVIAWQQSIDERNTGQRVQDMARYTDAICPMVYPSHFFGTFDGHKHPGDEPDYFVDAGVKKLAKITNGTGVTIRPWLQAFPWHVSNFTPRYVTTEIHAARREGAVGYLLWNAGNKYDVGFAGAKAAR